jgi:CspA family cold shock protein
MPNGKIKWYDDVKGYGFITPEDGGKDLFVHSTAFLTEEMPQPNQPCSYAVEPGRKGEQATGVSLSPLTEAAPAPVRKASPARVSAASDGVAAKGKVKWFNDAKGYGFITPEDGGKDLFVHHTAILMDGHRTLEENMPVAFRVVQGPKGPQAEHVTAA